MRELFRLLRRLRDQSFNDHCQIKEDILDYTTIQTKEEIELKI